ncbi:MFS transporter [Salmonella enterica]
MLAFLNQVRKPTLDLPLDVRRKMWFKPFMQSYLVVFIGYLTMYLIRKNFNIAQNDMISTYGLSMTELGMIGLGFSITYGVGKTLVSYYADGKNTKQFLPFMLILSAICMLGFSASMGAGSTSLFLMIAFYALSGFFQSTGGSCSYSTITKWTPRRKRGTFLGFWNISHNLGGAGAAGVALFGANYLFDGHVIGMFIFPSIIALGFLVFGPQLLIGVAAVGFVPKKAIGAADGIKGTFAYLIGDSFAKLGLGMIADGTPVFGLTGWAGTFAALDAAAIGCICLMAMVAVMEERKIRREKKIQQVNIA